MTCKQRTLHVLASAVAVWAVAAPAASAVTGEQFFGGQSEPAAVPPPPSLMAVGAAEEYEQLRAPELSGPYPVAGVYGDLNPRRATAEPVRVVRVTADGGFDWGDAGIGLAGGLALTALGAGIVVAARGAPGRRNVPQATS
jgi:hypothetical protein